MDDNELLIEKFKMIRINEIGISTDVTPIIGTQGLATCIGFILYSKEKKKAIVGHVNCDRLMTDIGLADINLELFSIMCDNRLINASFDLKIIEGAYKSKEIYSYELDLLKESLKDKYSLLEVLEESLKKVDFINVKSVDKILTSSNNIQTVDEFGNIFSDKGATLSNQFAFNSLNGEFVTDKVFLVDGYSKNK